MLARSLFISSLPLKTKFLKNVHSPLLSCIFFIDKARLVSTLHKATMTTVTSALNGKFQWAGSFVHSAGITCIYSEPGSVPGMGMYWCEGFLVLMFSWTPFGSSVSVAFAMVWLHLLERLSHPMTKYVVVLLSFLLFLPSLLCRFLFLYLFIKDW